MKRDRTSELKQPPTKLKESPAQRQFVPTKRDELKKFILDASDEAMQNADFQVKHLLAMIHFGTAETIEKILKFHPELVNQPGKKGNLPLMVVLSRKKGKSGFSLNLVKILLQYEANPFLTESKTQGGSLTPMEFITQNISKTNKSNPLYCKYVECGRLFEEYEKTHKPQIHQETSTELVESPALEPIPHSKMIKALSKFMSNASDETIKNSSFSAAHLFSMIHCGSKNAVEKILKFHPELLNQHGKSGKTPLMVVLSLTRAKKLNLKWIKKLLDYGANPFLRDIRHERNDVPLTPMEFVIQKQSVGGDAIRQAQYKECEALFSACEKKLEPQIHQENTFDLNPTIDLQPMLEIQDFNESEWMQYLEHLLDASELVLPNQDQFCEENLETDFFADLSPVILSDSKIIENRNKLIESTDFLEALPALDLSEQGRFARENIKLDLPNELSSLISDDSKTAEDKNELTASTDFLEAFRAKPTL